MNERSEKLKIGWIGFHAEGMPALESLLEKGYEIECVITLTPEELRKRCASTDYEPLCQRYGIPLYRVSDINSEDSLRLLEELSLDVVFVIGWSQILGREALSKARVGMIGVHASLLPHNRGSAPVNWAIIRGEAVGGNTLMWLDETLDGGDIIDQMSFPITVYDTCGTVYERVAETNTAMIERVLPKVLRGERPGRAQPPTDEPPLPRRRPEHGLVDWTESSTKVYNFIRALTKPYPGAFSWLDGKRWFIWSSALIPAIPSQGGIPGEIVGAVYSPVEEACGQLVACGQGTLLLLELESEDGEVLRGRNLSDVSWAGKVWKNGRED